MPSIFLAPVLLMDEPGQRSALDSSQSSPLTPALLLACRAPLDSEPKSDIASCATTAPETVMAEQVAQDVVKEAQSVGRPAPVDDSASTPSTPAVNGASPSGPETTHANADANADADANGNAADGGPVRSAHVAPKPHGDVDTVSRPGQRKPVGNTKVDRPRMTAGTPSIPPTRATIRPQSPSL